MAGARAATSLSFTIGIAFATLLVGGGILTGPAILDCSREPQSLGVCLRAKVSDAGFLPSEQVLPPLVSSEEPVLRAPGWIEANATEYDASASGAVQLSAEPGQLSAFGSLPNAPEVSAEIALVDPNVSLRADGLMPVPPQSGSASLAPAITGSIDAAGDGIPASGLTGDTSIEPPILPQPPAASGGVGVTAHGQGRASLAPQLIADLSPVPALAKIATPPAPPPAPALMPPPLAAPHPVATIEPPPPVAERRPPKYDPRYPNVLVLPPPNTGENSSFATLEVR